MFRKFLTNLYRSMSSNHKNIDNIQFLATYGTLRDDDNSGAIWTKDFIKDINSAVTGRIVGYQLFGNACLRYPFAIYTGNRNDSIVVRLLSWPTKEKFLEKIQQADQIEGDDYERKIVEVFIEDKIKYAYIYISKINNLNNDWKYIPSGDWLQRDFK